MNTGTMNADAWVQEYQRPFVKRKNVECHSGHLHQSNVPAAGFVLVRLNASSELEVLLELRSRTVSQPNTYGCIGGFAATKGEEAIDTAYREAKEEFGIEKGELYILGPVWKHDHGGIKYLTYTYIFAEYNPRNGSAPTPRSSESVRSQWFTLNSLPDNLIQYLREDLPAIKNILYYDVFPTLQARAKQVPQEPQRVPTITNVGAISNPLADADGDTAMSDANNPMPAPNTANSMSGDACQVSYPALTGQGSGSALLRGIDSVSLQQEQPAQTNFLPYPKLPSTTVPMQQTVPVQTVPMQTVPMQTVPMPQQTVPMQQQTVPMQTVSTQQTVPMQPQTVPMQTVPSQTVPMQQQTVPMQTVPMQQQQQTRRRQRTTGWREQMIQTQQQRAQRKLEQWQLRQQPLQQDQQQDQQQQMLSAPEENKVKPPEPQINKMAVTRPGAATAATAGDATKSYFSRLLGPFTVSSKNKPTDTPVAAEKKGMEKQAAPAATIPPQMNNKEPEFAKDG